jgi:hypothetical protein
MLRSSLAILGSVLVVALCASAPALADGPFEPNETPAEAYGPLMGDKISAAFETPQDVDWYRFYTLQHRQIGVLAALMGGCGGAYHQIRVSLLDGDGSYPSEVGYAYLGQGSSAIPATPVAQIPFTSLVGHRYFVKVAQSSCHDASYAIQVAPADDLVSTLRDTAECTAAKAAAKRERGRISVLQHRFRSAHGQRRRLLRGRLALQRQTSAVANGTEVSTCTRPLLTSYPFN